MPYDEAEHKAKEERGLALRRQFLGLDWERDTTNTTPGLQAFTDQAVECVWVQVWSNEDLDVRTKEAATLGAFIALGAMDELVPHVAGAYKSGVFTKKELRALSNHITPYVGYPAGRHAIVKIDEVLGALEGSDD